MLTHLALLSFAHAGTITVPADQPTIQDAIDAAAAGDVILVSPGSYCEALDVSTPVTIRADSTGNGGSVTLDGSCALGSAAVVKASADGIVLDGLLIDANYWTAGLQVSGGDVTGVGLVVQEGFGDVGGGVEVRSEGRFVCTDCRFEHNLAAQGGGIHSSGTLQLFDSSLCANESFGEGGGLFAKGATLIRRTAVVRNIASGPGGGAFVEEHRGTQLHNMVFLENVLRTNGGGEALHVAGAADVRNAIFVQHENEVALDNRDGDTPVATTSTPTTGWATSPPPTRKTSWTATSPSGTRASTATSTSAWSACPR